MSLSPWLALTPFIILGLIGLYLDRRKTNHYSDRRRANRYKHNQRRP